MKPCSPQKKMFQCLHFKRVGGLKTNRRAGNFSETDSNANQKCNEKNVLATSCTTSCLQTALEADLLTSLDRRLAVLCRPSFLVSRPAATCKSGCQVDSQPIDKMNNFLKHVPMFKLENHLAQNVILISFVGLNPA